MNILFSLKMNKVNYCYIAVALSLVLFSASALRAEPSGNYREGAHYFKIPSEESVRLSASKKVKVVEVFWYGCAHCFNFLVPLEAWHDKNKDTVTLTLLPVIWDSKDTKKHARIFYTAQALGVLDELHKGIFEYLLVARKNFGNVNAIEKFFTNAGVSGVDFQRVWNSFLVKHALKRADEATIHYAVRGTPSMIINDEYRVTPSGSLGLNEVLNIVDFLVAKVLAERNTAVKSSSERS